METVFHRYVDVRTNIVKTSSKPIFEVTFVEQMGYAESSKFVLLGGGSFAVVIPFNGFNPDDWLVVYKDNNGQHTVKYGGVIQGPPKPNIPQKNEGILTPNL